MVKFPLRNERICRRCHHHATIIQIKSISLLLYELIWCYCLLLFAAFYSFYLHDFRIDTLFFGDRGKCAKNEIHSICLNKLSNMDKLWP